MRVFVKIVWLIVMKMAPPKCLREDEKSVGKREFWDWGRTDCIDRKG